MAVDILNLPISNLPVNTTSLRASDGDEKLHAVAKEFESIFTAAILKTGLKSAMSINNDNSQGAQSNTYMEMAYEQIAHFIGRQGILGIADSLHENLTRR